MRSITLWLVGVALLAAAPVRADQLDLVSKTAASKLAEQFKNAGYKNVGVLKFEVQTGGPHEEYMNVGRMNELTATRLENSLTRLMAESPKFDPAIVSGVQLIGVSRGASVQAV